MSGVQASGVGSLPGTGARDAVRQVRDLFVGEGIPYLPELPARGPGADLIGRAASHLTELPVDLQPSGWRLADGSGRDAARGRAYLREDLDELAEAYDGYDGPLKLQVCGPWTLAGSMWLPRGERVVTDAGATRDLVQSLADGAASHVAAVRALVPGAQIVLQLDEPGLPAVLAGRLPTASGFGRTRAVEVSVVRDALTYVVNAVAGITDSLVLHCCAPDVPLPLVRDVPELEPAVDVSLLRAGQWDGIAELVESGRRIWAGVIPTDSAARHPREALGPFVEMWRRVGLGNELLGQVVVTPACGLAGRSPAQALAIQRLTLQGAQFLNDESA
ncbi:methionine synthase [Rudaeicoccus suwonensis]|uniref:Cobalamin-independent methionine synthase catalytic subunit n=1 Tax=Rudaeicoccus suwonensis TaxID=657409 RepID=A0A561DX38_9MICO|nr:methionine synthase [Rudaeicoccus suwonensis]TWE07906.1 cobalamin-independent methionine synthase catalytic subunit [Rudaeicoccus suwonensis]